MAGKKLRCGLSLLVSSALIFSNVIPGLSQDDVPSAETLAVQQAYIEEMLGGTLPSEIILSDDELDAYKELDEIRDESEKAMKEDAWSPEEPEEDLGETDFVEYPDVILPKEDESEPTVYPGETDPPAAAAETTVYPGETDPQPETTETTAYPGETDPVREPETAASADDGIMMLNALANVEPAAVVKQYSGSMWADSDELASAKSSYLLNTVSAAASNQTPIAASALVAAMLNKVGSGYSQERRYEQDYYDCSSLIMRCMNELGITQNVPITTADWDARCKNMKIGDYITFSGAGGTLTYQLTAKDITVLENPDAFSVPGTITVLIQPGDWSGHVAVSLGYLGRQTNDFDPEENGSDVMAATIDYVQRTLTSTYGLPAGLLSGTNRITGSPNVWLDTGHMGTDLYLEEEERYSDFYNPIYRVEAFNTGAGVCVDNLTTGTRGYNVRYVLVPTYTPQEPSIVNAYVTNLTSSGYTVNVEFSAPAGVKSVQMPTWTANNGQDDLIWHDAVINGNKASFTVPVSAHKNEKGLYYTHVYVTDKAGRQVIKGLEVTVPASVDTTPKITSVTKSDVTSSGYLVTVKFSAPDGIKEVLMPTWTINNGQDDLMWHTAKIEGSTASFYVKVSDHKNESGKYMTHIYVRDKNGKQVIEGIEVTVPAPAVKPENELKIIDIKTSDITAKGYQVTVTFTAPAGVQEVLMPTWTANNGQDDLIWHTAKVSGNTATFYVSASAHKNETGTYITHVYVKDKAGKQVLEGVEVTVPTSSSTLPFGITKAETSNVTSSGYQVTVTFNAPAGVKEVLMPTWTANNGQDDLIWHTATVTGNTATFYVPVSAHRNESGTYITHIYVRDWTGKEALVGLEVKVPEPSAAQAPQITGLVSSEVTANGYRVTVTFVAPAGIKEVLMPTWTVNNGQDDIVWHVAEVNGNTATFYIPISAHKWERGTYTTHVYVYDKKERFVLKGIDVEVK